MIVEGALIDSGIEVQCVRGEHVWLGAMGFGVGVGVGGYQPGVYVPLNALFLVAHVFFLIYKLISLLCNVLSFSKCLSDQAAGVQGPLV